MTSALSLLALGGCTAGEDCDSGETSGDTGCIAADDADADTDTDTDTDTDSDTDADATVAANWSATGLDLVITNGSAGGYYFGMAQTKSDGYIGEDCIDGNEQDPRAYGYDYCHTAGATGGEWVSVNLGVDEEELAYQADEGETMTALNDTVSAAGEITYILNAIDGSGCWVWGEDVAHYDAYGCVEI